MADRKQDLTLEELSKIALGQDAIGSVNIAALYTIIDVLLKKLDCGDDKVTLMGVPAESVLELLRNASPAAPPYKMDVENIKIPVSEECLEKKLDCLEKQLYDHIDSTAGDTASETQCTTAEIKDENVSKVLKLGWFNSHLDVHMKVPVDHGLTKLDRNVKALKKRMDTFRKECAKSHEEHDKISSLGSRMDELRKQIEQHRESHKETMIEIQGYLNSKANNCEIIPIKAEIEQLIKDATEMVNVELIPKAISTLVSIDREQVIIPLPEKVDPCEHEEQTCECKDLDIMKEFGDLFEYQDYRASEFSIR